MKLWHAPTGKLVKGHVLDVNEKAFNEALRMHDKQLYTTWNPEKLGGWGCWEIRRRPTQKTSIYQGSYEGIKFYKLYEVEFDHVHHVLDAAFLNYDAIRKIKEIDHVHKMREAGFTSAGEYQDWLEQNYMDEQYEKAELEREYNIKQHRKEAKALYEMVRSGQSLAQIMTSISWAQK